MEQAAIGYALAYLASLAVVFLLFLPTILSFVLLLFLAAAVRLVALVLKAAALGAWRIAARSFSRLTGRRPRGRKGDGLVPP